MSAAIRFCPPVAKKTCPLMATCLGCVVADGEGAFPARRSHLGSSQFGAGSSRFTQAPDTGHNAVGSQIDGERYVVRRKGRS